MVHPRGLDFKNQRRVMLMRMQQPPVPFRRIAELVRNLEGQPSTEDVVRRVHRRFNKQKGFVQYKFHKCGRHPWKLTKPVAAFVVKTLLKERVRGICTSRSLQAAVAKEFHVNVSAAHIRRHLVFRGFKWLPRSQKRKYNADMRRRRAAFVERYRHMSPATIARHISMAMDGVVLSVPPADPTDRKNFCLEGESHMWRKPGEAASPALSGADPYATQVPLSRAIPLWGAISARGFTHVVYHRRKKLTVDDWAHALDSGCLARAVDELQDPRAREPRRILCDNEKFLFSKTIRPRYLETNLELLPIPKRSPDLNPIESFWGWLRRRLRVLDLKDLQNGRQPMGKTAYKKRVKVVLRSEKAQAVARAKFKAFKKVCMEVARKHGAASRS